MKKRILLIDESLTVQKVVALTLDREQFTLSTAKSRSEAMKLVLESPPDLILASDQVAGLSTSAFPKEVETWVGRDRSVPPLILITSQSMQEQRGYHSVLKKPFSPQALQTVVVQAVHSSEAASEDATADDGDDGRLQKIFSDTFSDEAKLVDETFQNEFDDGDETLITIPAPGRPSAAPARPSGPPAHENVAELWGKASHAPSEPPDLAVLGPEDSMVYKAQLEKQVQLELESHDLESMVGRLLEKMVPPIVERLAQQRLDQLLKESENFVELKP